MTPWLHGPSAGPSAPHMRAPGLGNTETQRHRGFISGGNPPRNRSLLCASVSLCFIFFSACGASEEQAQTETVLIEPTKDVIAKTAENGRERERRLHR